MPASTITIAVMLMIVTLLIWLLLPTLMRGGVDTDTLKVLVPALVVVLGWVLTFFMQEYRHERERIKQEMDLQLALRAEIWDYLHSADRTDLLRSRDMVAQKILKWGDDMPFHPSIPQEKSMMIFSAFVQNIDRLPPETVDRIVQFYSQMNDVELFYSDLHSDSFMQMPAKRRSKAYAHFIDMKINAGERAAAAYRCLNKSLGVEVHRKSDVELGVIKQNVQGWLNSLDLDQSGH